MAKKTYARRYAQAVFEIALEAKGLEKWQSDLGKIVVVVGDAEFAAFLENPKFHPEAKAQLLSERLGEIDPLALNLVHLLITKGKLDSIGEIVLEYQRLLDSYHGIEQAEVVTAVSLDEADTEVVAGFLEAMVGKKLVLKTEVDARLLGGIVARIGGKLLDGSTRSRLATLKKELTEAGR